LHLIHSAHNPEADMLVAALHESGDDGVERPFARRQRVRMLRIVGERAAPIVQNESHALHGDSRSEDIGNTLDPRNDIAFAIHHA